jgi:hypothetical protein
VAEGEPGLALGVPVETLRGVGAGLEQDGNETAGIDEDERVAGVQQDAAEGSGQKNTGSL